MEQNKNQSKAFSYIKFNQLAMADWNKMFVDKPKKQEEDEKIANFKKRLDGFNNITTLQEAKELLNKTIPVQLERTVFFVGKAKCIIINKENRLRISFDTDKELICYDFA